MMRLRADLDLCDGYGNCVLEADDRFELNDDGLVEILDEAVPDADRQRVELAIASCPVSALRLEPG